MTNYELLSRAVKELSREELELYAISSALTVAAFNVMFGGVLVVPQCITGMDGEQCDDVNSLISKVQKRVNQIVAEQN